MGRLRGNYAGAILTLNKFRRVVLHIMFRTFPQSRDRDLIHAVDPAGHALGQSIHQVLHGSIIHADGCQFSALAPAQTVLQQSIPVLADLRRAASSQVIQTAVFALMKIGADFLLHRWDREQDENGDVTAKSLWNRFVGLFTESAAGNFLFGSEVYSIISNAMNGTDYDVVSAGS